MPSFDVVGSSKKSKWRAAYARRQAVYSGPLGEVAPSEPPPEPEPEPEEEP